MKLTMLCCPSEEYWVCLVSLITGQSTMLPSSHTHSFGGVPSPRPASFCATMRTDGPLYWINITVMRSYMLGFQEKVRPQPEKTVRMENLPSIRKNSLSSIGLLKSLANVFGHGSISGTQPRTHGSRCYAESGCPVS